MFGDKIIPEQSDKIDLKKLVAEADLIVGGVLIPGAEAPKVTNFGASAPGIKTPPTIKSASATNFFKSILSLCSGIILSPNISTNCFNLASDLSTT